MSISKDSVNVNFLSPSLNSSHKMVTIFLPRLGVGKVQPEGRIWPATWFCTCEWFYWNAVMPIGFRLTWMGCCGATGRVQQL